ncbi:alpha-2A adrenergic receptor-like [Ruditapes philippinarum]|uniref:alpha-2A adrenergic receptor-like n=1 Tax=Ruditapes philippinarum TaxID=129788 RepID=UPI00295ADA7F|nr:alpha-2A adrenergic receptor-like [Ruditapes philippinarum]
MESQEEMNTRYADKLLPLTVLFGFFSFVGVVGNIIVLLVFGPGSAYRRNNFRVFVVCLAIIDLLTSAFLIPAEMFKHRNYFSFGDLAICKVKCLFNVWAGCAAALTLLIISIDRYKKVCKPFRTQISPGCALKLCVFLAFFLSVILSVPGAVMCGINETNMTNIHGNLTTVFMCETEEKFKNHIFRKIYKFAFILLLLGVSGACVVMYILIGRQIAKHWGSVPVNFRKDSDRLNSDFSSETFGKIQSSNNKKSVETLSSVADDPDQIYPSLNPMEESRSSVVKANGNVEMNQQSSQKRLIKQQSTTSTSSGGNRKGDTAQARRKTMTRQGSGFGLRRFPYKTLIWFILTIVFIVTYIVYLALATQVPKIPTMTASSFALFQSFYRIYFINNIINPIVYVVLDKNFRTALGKVKDKMTSCFHR